MKIMHFIVVLAILLGIVAASASAYALIETKPNLEALEASLERGGQPPRLREIEHDLLSEYVTTINNLILLSLGAGALAVVLGGVAVAKGKKPAALVGILLGIAGALVGILATPT